MSWSGHIYGIALNDSHERARLAQAFKAKPYVAAPEAPVIYMKPACSLARGPIPVPGDGPIVAASTLALLLCRDTTRCQPHEAMSCVGAIALALDLSLPQDNYYRPAIGQAIRQSSLALGEWMPVAGIDAITTAVSGREAHRWRLDRLHRDPGKLISALSEFMTLRAGDILLVGLPGDAPVLRGARELTVAGSGLPALTTHLVEESA